MFAIIAIIITVTAVAAGGLGGGGGGGGGSSSPASSGGSSGGGSSPPAPDSPWMVSSYEANIYRTPEYNAQWGLEAIHAAEAYAALAKNNKTVAGEGVTIAITDTGAQANHIDIAGNLNADVNYNYFYNTNDISDTEGHGTHVASIAAGVENGSGIKGVAHDANLVIADIFNDAGSEAAIDTGISGSAAIEGVKVINASWKYGSYTSYNGTPSGTNSSDRAVIAALNIAKTNDILFVAATGNDADNAGDGGGDSAYLSKPKPAKPALFANNNDLAGYVLAVAAVDQDLQIADFSNICGIASGYCLVAPGVNIYAASSDTNTIAGVGANGQKYATLSGASMAAPHVSGAAAVLRAAWPLLTAPQVADILLKTATDLGAAGKDTTYGYGMLNLYAAVQAQGSNSFNYGNKASQTSYDLRSSSFAADPIFGDAFAQNVAPALQNAIFFDEYGRDYKASLASKISASAHATTSSNIGSVMIANNYKTNILPLSFGAMNDKNSPFATQIKVQMKSYSDIGKKLMTLDKSRQDEVLNSGNGFALRQNFNKKSQLIFAFNVDEIKNLVFENENNFNFISINSLAANPYQSFIASPYQSGNVNKNFNQIAWQQKFFNNKLKLNFSHQTSYNGTSGIALQGLKQNQISDFNFNYRPSTRTNLALSIGRLNEFNNNFLNSRGVGAFESGGGATTSYFKIAAMQNIYKSFSLISNFSRGFSKVAGNNFGIFREYQNIKSEAAALGLVNDDVFGGGLGVLYSQPLRVYSGSVKVDVPIAVDASGNVLRYTDNISLKPQGKEQDFELFYAKNLNNFTQFSVNFLNIKEAGNVKSAKDVRFVMINYSLKF